MNCGLGPVRCCGGYPLYVSIVMLSLEHTPAVKGLRRILKKQTNNLSFIIKPIYDDIIGR